MAANAGATQSIIPAGAQPVAARRLKALVMQ